MTDGCASAKIRAIWLQPRLLVRLSLSAVLTFNPSQLTHAQMDGASYKPSGPRTRLWQSPAEHDKGVLRGVASINLIFLPRLGALERNRLCMYDRVRRCQLDLRDGL